MTEKLDLVCQYASKDRGAATAGRVANQERQRIERSDRRAATYGEMSIKRTEFAVLSSGVSCLPFACWMIRTVVKSSSKSLISRPRSSPMRQPQEAARIMSIR